MNQELMTLDFWQDTVIYESKTFPVGTLACDALNVPVCNLVRRTEKGRLRRRGWGLRWEKAQKGGKGTNLRGFFED